MVVAVLYVSVELLSLHDEEAVAGLDDAALCGDGAGSVDVVASHHPHRDAGPLALLDGLGHLGTHGVLDADDAYRREVADDLVFVVPIGLGIVTHLGSVQMKAVSHHKVFSRQPKYVCSGKGILKMTS